MSETLAGAPAAGQAVSDPRWLPDRIDFEQNAALFVRTERAALAREPFLDARWRHEGLPQTKVKLDALPGAVGASASPVNFIWHSAFCCSTLIAQCLDAPGRNLSLKEPQVLQDISNAKRTGLLARHPLGDRLAAAVFHLLGRRFAEGEAITIKPSNQANNLARDAVAATSGRMLFLYSNCRSFLISLAKKGEAGRAFARKWFTSFAMDGHEQAGWPPRALFEMSDLQIAALVWHMQLAEFRRSWPQSAPARAAALDCALFLADPGAVLRKLDDFFGLHLGEAHIAAVQNGSLLRRDAKNAQEPFDAQRRAREAAEMGARLGPELDRIVEWSYGVCPATPRAAPLPNPLTTGAGERP